jgi:transketolase
MILIFKASVSWLYCDIKHYELNVKQEFKKMVDENKKKFLEARALQLRIDSLRATTASGSGHPTTCLSCADVVSVLFFDGMNFDIADPFNKDNDRFIMSKGHGIPVVYSAYKQLGVISDTELMDLRKFDSPLEGHPTPRFVYNEAATGSLGQGLAIGLGMAINAKFENLSYKTYVLLGDGELAEGSIWEAADLASHYKLNNLIAIVDCNRLGQTGETPHGHDADNFAKKFKAFGFNSVVVDGHDIEKIQNAVETAKKSDAPTAIVAKTYKGYGVDFVQDFNGHHGKPLKKDDCEKAIGILKKNFPTTAEFLEKNDVVAKKVNFSVNKKSFTQIKLDISTDKNRELLEKDQSIATRKAFGYGLAELGRKNKEVIVLDADVKNSTFTEIFEKEFPDRLIECFIAEQAMVGAATGLQIRGKISFAATFGAFFTRAHDQIRMAGVGRNALRLCGSHCGVSIGEDGPSQMGMEDIAMMRSIPDSVVFYPSDGVSAYKLVECMANYQDGISYMRTTRSATPILYGKDETFSIGGCKVLKESDKDKVCIVAAGITLHEALKAYEELKSQGIFVSVVDAYSVKPLDVETIERVAKKSGKILTVEDHYAEGGLGEAVASAFSQSDIGVEILAVKTISRSGKSAELLKYAGIDWQSIVEKVLL